MICEKQDKEGKRLAWISQDLLIKLMGKNAQTMETRMSIVERI